MATGIPASAQDRCRWATTEIWEMEGAGSPGKVAHRQTCLRCGASRLVPAVEGHAAGGIARWRPPAG